MFTVHKDRQKQQEISSSKSKTVSQAGVKHGDMIYVTPKPGSVLIPTDSELAEPMQTENDNAAGTSMNNSGSSASFRAGVGIQRQLSTASIAQGIFNIIYYSLKSVF